MCARRSRRAQACVITHPAIPGACPRHEDTRWTEGYVLTTDAANLRSAPAALCRRCRSSSLDGLEHQKHDPVPPDVGGDASLEHLARPPRPHVERAGSTGDPEL